MNASTDFTDGMLKYVHPDILGDEFLIQHFWVLNINRIDIWV